MHVFVLAMLLLVVSVTVWGGGVSPLVVMTVVCEICIASVWSERWVCVLVHLAADCDNDDHCAGALVCGTDNCAQFHGDVLSSTTDCCEVDTSVDGACNSDDDCTQGSDFFCNSQVCSPCCCCCCCCFL